MTPEFTRESVRPKRKIGEYIINTLEDIQANEDPKHNLVARYKMALKRTYLDLGSLINDLDIEMTVPQLEYVHRVLGQGIWVNPNQNPNEGEDLYSPNPANVMIVATYINSLRR